MADLKLQAHRAIPIVPSDTINIPQAGRSVSNGTTTSLGSGANDLIDSAATFTDGSVSVGDVVHDETNGVIDTISAIVDDNNLTLTSGTAVADAASYKIYDKTTDDCSWYVGVSGDVQVLTVGGDTILLTAVPVGWQPLQIRRVDSTNTTATNMVAGW